MFVIFFFGIFAYFLWKTFSQPSRNETREIFEFYLAANEILRDDERRWFGFEVQEVVGRGERILQMMNGAPPLVYFTLGALYNKIGDYKSAVNHLSYVVENENARRSDLSFIHHLICEITLRYCERSNANRQKPRKHLRHPCTRKSASKSRKSSARKQPHRTRKIKPEKT